MRIVGDRNTPQKHAARARIILATADGCGTMEIMRRSGTVEAGRLALAGALHAEGVDGLLRDKTRQPGKAPLPAEMVKRVVDLTLARTARRDDALDGPAHGQGGRRQPALGPAHLGGARPRAAPCAHLQAVEDKRFAAKFAMSSASMSIRRRMQSCSRSTRRAKSRRSTAPSRACR